MARIESIRPGDAFQSDFEEYALPELLIGLLRGNLTGILEIDLSPVRPNFIYFKDGVPISVTLPDLDVSLSGILVEQGALSKSRGDEVERRAKESGRSESQVIGIDELVPNGVLHEGMRRRARSQLVRLFNVGRRNFRFVEGAAMPKEAELAILQPLPVIFHGLLGSNDQGPMRVFMDQAEGARFRLADTYPRGVDPFEWGDEIEQALTSLETVQGANTLVKHGIPREKLGAVLISLHLAGMLETVESRHSLAARPFSKTSVPPPVASTPAPSPPRERRSPSVSRVPPMAGPIPPTPAQLYALDFEEALSVIPESFPPRVSSGEQKIPLDPAETRPPMRLGRPVPDKAGPKDRPPEAAASADSIRADLAARLAPYREKSYFEVLRVTPSTSADQLERSYRYLKRQEDSEKKPQSFRALQELLDEAFEAVTVSPNATKYKKVADKAQKKPAALAERREMEAGPKLERAIRALGLGRIWEADYLLGWAQELAPGRPDLRTDRAFLYFVVSPESEKNKLAKSLMGQVAGESERPGADLRFKLYQVMILSALGERAAAKEVLKAVADTDHAMYPLAKRALESG